jgi:hypothetical protein
MSSTPVPVTEFKERLFKDQHGHPYFTMVVCPHCKLNSRLLWPTRLTSYPKGMFKFECGKCLRITQSTELDVHSICHMGCGCEDRPSAIVVMA